MKNKTFLFMKRLSILLAFAITLITCIKPTVKVYSQNVAGTVIPDNVNRVQRVRVTMSQTFRNQGRGHWTVNAAQIGTVGVTAPADVQIAGAAVQQTQTIPTSDSLPPPPVFNQNPQGSCVSAATAYAHAIEQYITTGASSYHSSTNIFSVSYLYNQVLFTPGDCLSGSAMTQNLDIIVNQGECLDTTFPYNSSDCVTLPNSSQRTAAANFKIASYSSIVFTDRTAIKQAIAAGHPVICSFAMDNNFLNASGDFIWNSSTAGGGGAAGHTVAIIGYNDNTNTYRIINSYGTGWGNNGFARIDYSFFELPSSSGGKFGYYCYYINMGSTPPANQPPVTNVCCNQTVTSGATVPLDGSGSYDPDGTITGYSWTQVSGPNSATISNSTSSVASATGLITGTYVFKLTCTDNSSATSSATLTIVVQSAETYTLSGFKQVVRKGATTDVLNWNIQLASAPSSVLIQVSYTSPSSGFSTLADITTAVTAGQTTGTVTTNPTRTQLRKARYYRININASSKISNVVKLL
jgi:hypothetical protein